MSAVSSPQAANPISDTVTDNVPEPNAPATFDLTKFVNHIKQYPLVACARDIMYSIPYTQRVRDCITPPIVMLREYAPLNQLVEKSDAIGDDMLHSVDRTFPLLKTLEVHHFTDPVTRPVYALVTQTQETFKSCRDSLIKTVVEPTAKSVNDARYYVHTTIHDSNGKSIITSPLDPVVAPVNVTLENCVLSWFPGTEEVSHEHSSEICRTILILNNVMKSKKSEPATEPVEETPETNPE